jgi:hypothetical protein
MTGDAWDTEFGQFIFARADYYRRLKEQSLPSEQWRPIASVDVESKPPVVESADAAFAREIELAHEVCDDQVAADAIVSMPAPSLPFGGESK